MKVLIIDNYDSFTYNLAQLVFRVSQVPPLIIQNNELTYEQILSLSIDAIIVSAGPGRPENFDDLGVSRDIIMRADKPVLGICLGMQAIVHYHGGTITFAPEQMHGRTSAIKHDSIGLFANIPQHFTAMRYHSLIVHPGLPANIIRTAWTEDDITMAIQHKTKPLWGVQFHPESVSSSNGAMLIQNFLRCIEPTFSPFLPTGISTPSMESVPKQVQVVTYHKWINPDIVFEKLFASSDNCFWLDSNNSKHELSKRSYMGDSSGPHSHSVQYDAACQQITINGDSTSKQHIFDYLDKYLEKHCLDYKNVTFEFCGGFVGWFGYELDNLNVLQKSKSTPHRSEHPDAAFIFVDRFLVFDHELQSISLVIVPIENCATTHSRQDSHWINSTIAVLDTLSESLSNTPSTPLQSSQEQSDLSPLKFDMAMSRKDYIKKIKCAKEKIRQGESYELCLTNSLSTNIQSSGFDIYKILRTKNPAPFSSYLKIDGIEVVSSSPERFLAIDRNRKISSKPIKGTIARDSDPKIDTNNKRFLQTNIKDSAENLMIVDLLRNDLSKVCQNDSVKVPSLLKLESFATVHQLVSTIEGIVDHDKSTIDCIKACFPGGSMTGAPKIRSMEILATLESQARGIYSGALGYFSLNKCCDLSIVIRTIIIKNNKATIGCGGAIVALSDAEQEYSEILLKAKSLIEAIVIAERGEFKPSFYTIAD